MYMNIFIRENFGRSVTFKNIISGTFESRFLSNLTETPGNDERANGLLFIE